ncbi:MAG: FIST C-terminal domain-containing protein [Spirochaetaceae bacterium]|nr:FIST C-terminal domain-containing protein [Spirochaetaceae bacterium]
MINLLTACTSDVDDTDAAIRDILEQLDIRYRLLKNTVGLLFCHLDFIKSGAVEAVYGALPFEVVGCTTLGAAVPGAMGDIVLTLTVLTSDDVEFHTRLSDPLTEDQENRISRCYREAAAAPQIPPSLILIFIPSLYNLAGDTVVGVLNRESRGTPIFGAGALDADTKIRTPKTFYGGRAYADRMPILLLSGNLKPKFFIDSVWKHDIHSQKVLITAAEGNRIISVENMPAADYVRKIGLIPEEAQDLLFVFPLAIDAGGGAPLSICIIYTINDDGSLTCSANIPAGSTLRISSPGSGAILKTAKNITDAVKRENSGRPGQTPLLIFSCFSRSVAQTNPHDEMEMIQGELENTGPSYIFIYTGGEICPIYDKTGLPVNQYHNYAIISCLLAEAGE